MTESFEVQPYEGPVTQSMMALLLEADPSVEAVNQYISRAQIFVCTDQHKSVGIAAVVVTDETAAGVYLKPSTFVSNKHSVANINIGEVVPEVRVIDIWLTMDPALEPNTKILPR